jgi:hypothetical protein
MTLPLTTCRINILRSDPAVDPMVDSVYLTKAAGIPAVLHSDTGFERRGGGTQAELTARLDVPLGTDLRRYDQVYDQSTGETWEVDWVRARVGFGLDHVEAGLHWVEGAVNNG